MSKKKQKTKMQDPFELIQSARLVYKKDPSLFVGIRGTKFECLDKNRFRMKSFEVIKPEPKYDSDKKAVKIFNRIKRFAILDRNFVEVITLFIDVYKENKEYVDLKITTFPVHRNSLDVKYIFDQLINNEDEDDEEDEE